MASFKDFCKAHKDGGVQVGVRSWISKADAPPEQRVCSTSQPCRCQRRRAPSAPKLDESSLVSVICPTTAARRELHPALYASFACQRHARVELLVLDTGGKRPSAFFEGLDDDRVRYFHEPELVLGENGAECVGIKRNRLCALAEGAAIACFDDDNVYAPTYVSVMLHHLCASGSALLTLGAYYTAEPTPDGTLVGGWLNSNKGAASDRYLELRGVVVGRAKKNWDKRGETFFFPKRVFDRKACRFTETLSIGEEGAFYRGDDFHAIVDDAGIFVHVDHGRNTGAPLSHAGLHRDLPTDLAQRLRDYEPFYRKFAASVADGSAEVDIRYQPLHDGFLQVPRQGDAAAAAGGA